jgi:hypothetical protein
LSWRVTILYTCHKEIGCTFEVWSSAVSLEEWLDHCRNLAADPAWPAGNKHLTDLSTSSDISSIYESDLYEVSELFSILPERIARLKLALFTGDRHQRKPELFALFLSSTGVSTRVCRALEDACAWLGIDRLDAEKILAGLRAEIQR